MDTECHLGRGNEPELVGRMRGTKDSRYHLHTQDGFWNPSSLRRVGPSTTPELCRRGSVELLIGVQLSRHEVVDSLCYLVGDRLFVVVGPKQ